VRIKFFATFRDLLNLKEIEINLTSSESYTIGQLLEDLIDKFPTLQAEIFNEDKTIRRMTHILVNGRNIIHLQGLETDIKSTDEIALIPPVGGG